MAGSNHRRRSTRAGRDRHTERGATMVSTMLLTSSLLTMGMLMVGNSARELRQASAQVQRERALMAAQATIDLASARYRRAYDGETSTLSEALTGYNTASNPNQCSSIGQDCIPGLGNDSPATGQRNSFLTDRTDCSGRPCMRPGAVGVLPDNSGTDVDWAEVNLADLMAGGDPSATVSLWVRNDTYDALGQSDGSWTTDTNEKMILTAMARVGNATVAVEQEIVLGVTGGTAAFVMPTPDEGYGGGHNNDNSSVQVCADSYVEATESD